MIKKIVSVLLFALSIVYVLHGFDLRLFVRSVHSFSITSLVGLVVAFVTSYALIAIRWMFLSRGTIGFLPAYEASVVCAGINNLMPARLGDVSRMVFLRKVYSFPYHKSVAMTFMERLFDLIGLATIGLLLAFYVPEIRPYVYPTLMVILIGILATFLVMRFPGMAVRFIKLIRVRKLKRFFVQSIIHMRKQNLMFFLKLYFMSLLIWGYYILVMFVFLKVSSGIHLSIFSVITVFVISSLGVSLPSTPASFGVYEAAIILAMSWFGIGKEPALSFALVYHIVMIVCSVAIAFLVMYLKDFKYASNLKNTSTPSATTP